MIVEAFGELIFGIVEVVIRDWRERRAERALPEDPHHD